MNAKITTEKQYEAALEEILRLWDAMAGTLESDRLNELVDMVVEYEDKRWPANRRHQNE